MTTNYPTHIDDTSSLPVVSDNVNKVNAEVVNRLRGAILAIESELGTKPSGISGTIRNRLDEIEIIVATINSSLTLLNASMGTISVLSGAVISLTEEETSYARLKLTGTLTANVDVIIPPGTNLGWARDIWNATTGAFTLTVKTTVGGSGVVIAQNTIKRLFADTTNVMSVG